MRLINRICNALEQHGPMTVFQLADVMQHDVDCIRASINSHRHGKFACESRAIRIKDFIQTGLRPTVVMEIGDEPDMTIAKSKMISAQERKARTVDLKVVDEALAARLAVLRAYAGNPFGVAMAQCGVAA